MQTLFHYAQNALTHVNYVLGLIVLSYINKTFDTKTKCSEIDVVWLSTALTSHSAE